MASLLISLSRPKISVSGLSSLVGSFGHSLLKPKAAPLSFVSRSLYTISGRNQRFEDSDSDSSSDHDISHLLHLLREVLSLRDRMCQVVKEKPIPHELLLEFLRVLGWNLFVKEGNQAPHVWTEDEKNVYSRVEMPGVEQAGSKLWVDPDGHLQFLGVAEQEQEQELDPELGKVDAGRKFKLKNNFFSPLQYDVENIRYVIKNGVMWIVVPKLVPGLHLGMGQRTVTLTSS
ncbi:heat shock protein 14.7 [Corchorus capsularis]|uniref:Heat shock protein 14.7 n=1 Tax=Corchorus capsularis TaxID=210143 RepID=A0A1R3GNI8_COCAP|nr:heat shock protein 14.7 [Corchorus capsularis]